MQTFKKQDDHSEPQSMLKIYITTLVNKYHNFDFGKKISYWTGFNEIKRSLSRNLKKWVILCSRIWTSAYIIHYRAVVVR